jgi:ribonuclease HI
MEIYTDGSCTPNPGPGTIGVKWRHDIRLDIGEATSNTAELTAILLAAGLAWNGDTIVTDSRVCLAWIKKGHAKNCQVPGVLKVATELIREKHLKRIYGSGENNPAHEIAEG